MRLLLIFPLLCILTACDSKKSRSGLVSRIDPDQSFIYNGERQLVSRVSNPITELTWVYQNENLTEHNVFAAGDLLARKIYSSGGTIMRVEYYPSLYSRKRYQHYVYEDGYLKFRIDSIENKNENPSKIAQGITEYFYDSKGNIIQSIMRNGDELIEEYNYSYDDQLNPFHGKYTSWEEGFVPFTSPNNVTKLVYINYVNTVQSRSVSTEFTYYKSGYPKTIDSQEIEYYAVDF